MADRAQEGGPKSLKEPELDAPSRGGEKIVQGKSDFSVGERVSYNAAGTDVEGMVTRVRSARGDEGGGHWITVKWDDPSAAHGTEYEVHDEDLYKTAAKTPSGEDVPAVGDVYTDEWGDGLAVKRVFTSQPSGREAVEVTKETAESWPVTFVFFVEDVNKNLSSGKWQKVGSRRTVVRVASDGLQEGDRVKGRAGFHKGDEGEILLRRQSRPDEGEQAVMIAQVLWADGTKDFISEINLAKISSRRMAAYTDKNGKPIGAGFDVRTPDGEETTVLYIQDGVAHTKTSPYAKETKQFQPEELEVTQAYSLGFGSRRVAAVGAGDRVRFVATPAGVMLYDEKVPASGTEGTVEGDAGDPARKFVNVRWDDGSQSSVFRRDVEKVGVRRTAAVDENKVVELLDEAEAEDVVDEDDLIFFLDQQKPAIDWDTRRRVHEEWNKKKTGSRRAAVNDLEEIFPPHQPQVSVPVLFSGLK